MKNLIVVSLLAVAFVLVLGTSAPSVRAAKPSPTPTPTATATPTPSLTPSVTPEPPGGGCDPTGDWCTGY